MKEFHFSTGTNVAVTDKIVEIVRGSGKSVAKGLLAGRVMGLFTIKLDSITGVQMFGDYLFIYASGLPSPNDFKITSTAEIKQYPNCIVAKNFELEKLYLFLVQILMGEVNLEELKKAPAVN